MSGTSRSAICRQFFGKNEMALQNNPTRIGRILRNIDSPANLQMNGIYSLETNCGFFSERMSFFRRMVVESILLSHSSNFPRENYLTEIIWAFPRGSKDPWNVGAKDPRNAGRRILGMWDMCFSPLCVNDRSERSESTWHLR